MGYLKNLVQAFAVCLSLPNVATPFAAPTQYQEPLVIDTFKTQGVNDLGVWAGPDAGMAVEYNYGSIRLFPTDPEMTYNTQLTVTCKDMTSYANMYLHVIFSGTDKFSISLMQTNGQCDPSRSPYPETWDSLEASRYARGEDIYIPINHFKIDLTKALSVAFNGFYTKEEVRLSKVEITSAIPAGFAIPEKLESGTLAKACKRPNSFAFGIDDGQPRLAQEVMKILEEENVKATFFTVGTGLKDPHTNFSSVYREMLGRGHQVALHSQTHPKMEGLKTLEEIQWEISEDVKVTKEALGIESRYFRPPYGVVGARTRQVLGAQLRNPYIINWSVDIEDWRWADGPTPEKQFEAFKRDVQKGGNLAVMHFLHPSTVSYYRDVIKLVRDMGMQIMRVDQCMEDPEAPPL